MFNTVIKHNKVKKILLNLMSNQTFFSRPSNFHLEEKKETIKLMKII